MRYRVLAVALLAGSLVVCGPEGVGGRYTLASSEATPAMEARVQLTGAVVDAAGEPVAGAQLRVWPLWREVEADDQGAFSLSFAPPAEAEVRVFATAPGFAVEGVSLGIGAQLDDTIRVALTLKPERVIEGRLLDEAGAPVAEARVALRLAGTMNSAQAWATQQVLGSPGGFGLDQVRTDADGRFRFARVDTGAWAVVALEENAGRWGPARAWALVPPEPSPDWSLRLGEGLQRPQGRVLDALTGDPVPGARVFAAWGQAGSAYSVTEEALAVDVDPSSSVFQLPALAGAAEHWHLWLRAPDYVTEIAAFATTEVGAGDGEEEGAPVYLLGKSHDRILRVLDGHGRPAFGVTLQCLGIQGDTAREGAGGEHPSGQGTSDAFGLMRLDQVPQGLVQFEIHRPWICTPSIVEVDLRDPVEQVATVRLPWSITARRFPVRIQVAPRGPELGDELLAIDAVDASGEVVAEWRIRQQGPAERRMQLEVRRYELHAGGDPHSLYGKVWSTRELDWEGWLPAGTLRFRVRRGAQTLDGPTLELDPRAVPGVVPTVEISLD